MDFLLLTILAFACYAVTTLVTKSYALKWLRIVFRAAAGKLPFWLAEHFTLIFVTAGNPPVLREAGELEDGDPPTEGFDFISCPMCVGFWVSLIVCAACKVFAPSNILAVYGASYFIHRSEKF